MLLQEPQVLLCDEATSALDATTEKEIFGALQTLAKGRTSLFVAHRLSTAANCDQVRSALAGFIQADRYVCKQQIKASASFHTSSAFCLHNHWVLYVGCVPCAFSMLYFWLLS